MINFVSESLSIRLIKKKHIIFVACHGRAVLYYFDKQLDSLRALPQRINDWHIACYPFANHFVFI